MQRSTAVLIAYFAVIFLMLGIALCSCKKANTPAKQIPSTFEIKVEGINADNTSAGESPVAVFYSETK